MTDAPWPTLASDDLDAYFAELWDGLEPFPWQRRLLSVVLERRRWPRLIDLPTGAGKTSVVDLAVFALALQAELPPAQQWHPRRLVLVVDRRVVVDQADDRAHHIAARLASASGGVLAAVAERLRRLAPGPDGEQPEEPLRHSVLRGGLLRDESWAHRPDVPAVLCSTVDQVGSRLLFRGYGISRGMRPVHAGLLSQDVLYLLDEVHLAEPFADTLAQVERYRRLPGGTGLPDRWQVVRMSATPGSADDDRFPPEPLTRGEHPLLDRRLAAVKPARLLTVPVPTDPEKARQKLAEECVRQVRSLLDAGARTVAVIVNRVDTACRVRALLDESVRHGTAALLSGRMRPVEKERLLADVVLPRVALGRRRAPDDPPFVLVSTQSIEAGADFDLDGLVTECASLDALRQRFGRVDRNGELSAADRAVTSVVLAASTSVAAGAVDPVYGTSLRATWDWLHTLPEVDFGLLRLPSPSDAERGALLPVTATAPVLLPSHLDRWVQTSDDGLADPDVAHWLHGIEASAQAADVGVVWRDDLDAGLLAAAAADTESGRLVMRGVTGRLEACPPLPGEVLPVPTTAIRRWLAGVLPGVEADGVLPEVADVETGRVGADVDDAVRGEGRLLRWREARAEVVRLDEVAPGDTLVVPTSFGGVQHACWSPGCRQPVLDVRHLADPEPAALRLTRARFALADFANQEAPLFPDPEALAELLADERRDLVRDYLRTWLESGEHRMDPAGVPLENVTTVQRLVQRGLRQVRLLDLPEAGDAAHSVRSYVLVQTNRATAHAQLSEEDGRDATSFLLRRTTLSQHLMGVERWARTLTANLGLGDEVSKEVSRAAVLHDLGKLDPRFQTWLHGGQEWRAMAESEPLAKSTVALDSAGRRQARERSGYPAGLRHELFSVGLTGDEPPLVRHLVASHHGRARYRFEVQPWVEPRPVAFDLPEERFAGDTDYDADRLDSGVADTFWSQVRQWGWWGLAWLEAVLRLADHADSRSRDQDTSGVAP